jgi:hypothetical protein
MSPRPEDLGAAAVGLAERSFLVFRLRPRDKRPLKEGWPDEATTGPAKVARLWNENPTANIGIACGTTCWVLDVDGEAGRDSLRALQAEHGRLSPTVTSRTGSGGYHLLFAAEPRVRNSVRRLGPGLDTRGAGGYIVAPPSIHPNGKRYAWLRGREPGSMPLAKAPGWLLDRLDPPRPGKPLGSVGPIAAIADAYGRAALRKAVERVGAAAKGQRNATLNAESFGLGQLVGAGILPAEVAATALAGAALAIGLERRETERTIASALRAGAAQPRRPADAR